MRFTIQMICFQSKYQTETDDTLHLPRSTLTGKSWTGILFFNEQANPHTNRYRIEGESKKDVCDRAKVLLKELYLTSGLDDAVPGTLSVQDIHIDL